MSDALAELSAAGVAVWLDDISRQRLNSGNLAQLVTEKHVVGVTSNPTIFAKALEDIDTYAETLTDLKARKVSVDEAVRMVTATDIRDGADLLRPVFDRSGGVDGRVSLEVDPRLANETEATIAEAKALWWLVDRPNLFIKIPATKAGLPAITAALAQGISVNVTLIFSLQRYNEVMEAYLAGLEQAKANGHDLTNLASVASFFVSRVDTEIDKRLDKLGSDEAKALRGKAAIANARLAYRDYEQVFSTERWKALAAAGAKPQRPLWASTGVKDPAYDDTQYVVELVAPGVVNTMPEATLKAVEDHGVVRGDTVTSYYPEAQATLDALAGIGIDYDDVVDLLEREGVSKFEQSWVELLDSVKKQLSAVDA
ncbi:transaldolase [Cryptosporangium aurantiacum]|uniref:Transaldolase n=1 Tax=Cryptosporangium aurantiacum TaxID=134849 RepID=A0A1M7J5C7_9ACTN|nr:transaldolase [Cryptosporangium aurantiacum]SHM48340.1 transaldolase [Cryptosporangium aurantiacum]